MSKDVTPSVAVGARCYIPDEDAAWLPVYVEEVNEPKGLVTVRVQRPRRDQQDEDTADHDDADRTGETRIVAIDVGFPLQNAQLSRYDEGLDNMIDLNHLHEAAILRNLKKRFRARKPYTYTGDICLAVNPYQWLDELYTPGLHKKYQQARKRQDLPPHVYAVSVAAFRHMCDNGSNQSILVSGESGAGKTETTKIVMDNLATIAPAPSTTASDQEHSITTRIIEVNPLLESFGNAKTTRNDNSSRFGKFTQLQFDKNHALCGAQCETYLLEKTRVISHEHGERNYHIFYQLLHGTTDEERDALGLGDECPKFSYLEEKEPRQETRPGRKSRPSAPPPPKSASVIEAENAKDRALFAKTKQALSLLGLGSDQQNELFQVLSGILHLGEAQFVAQPGNDEACDLDQDSVIYSCVLLGLDPNTMGKALTHRTVKAVGEVYLVPLTVEQAQSGRDALAKAIYASVFDWLVAGINASLGAAPRLTANMIGVLDIFGFESFESNSFEQLCINYANEKLQQKFTQDVFKAVQEEYEREKITWAHISYADNSETLALIEGRMGVLALLNEEIVRPRGSEEGFVSKLSGAYVKQKNLIEFPRISKTQFAIHHYAGTVKYEATGFLDKHKDALLSDLSDLMCGSSELFPQMLFKVRAEMEAAAAASAASLKRSTSGGRGVRIGSGGGGGDKTVGMQFKQSLNSLMTNINETNVNYIRCIKPNSVKSSTLLEDKMVATQLRCAGVIEAICIARAGYPNRLLHAEFAEQFDIFLTEQEQLRLKEDPEQYGETHCRVLVKKFKLEMPEEYQMGVTKIYLQKGVLEKCEHAKAQKLFAYVALIQAHWRGVRTRRQYYEMRAALITIQRRAKVFVTRCRFLRAQLAIALIQRVWHGYVGRCEFHAVLSEHCALQIQRVWRGYVGRCEFHAVLSEASATRIQRMYRGHKGRQIYFAVLCQTRAVRLQCFTRQYLARQELYRRRAAYIAKLEKEERERVERELELARQRKLAEERERQRKLQEELARLEEERRQEEARRVELLRQDSALMIQRQVRGYFARCVFAEMVQEAEEEERRRREEEEERERIRLQREHDEREAQRRAAEEAAREKQRLAEERKEKARLMRQRRENAVILIQRVVRGHLARKQVTALKAVVLVQRVVRGHLARKEVAVMKAAMFIQRVVRGHLARKQVAALKAVVLIQRVVRGHLARKQVAVMKEEARREAEAAAIRLQSIQRGRLARQNFSKLKIEKDERDERDGEINRVREEFSKFKLEKAEQDDELARMREENAMLKQQLAEFQRINEELEAAVAEHRCDRDVVKASNNLKEVELTQKLNTQRKELESARGEYSTLCGYLEKANSSRSTEPEELNSSDSSSTSGDDEENEHWKEDRPTIDSTSASYFEGDRPSTDIAKLLGSSSRTSRLANAMQQRRQKASEVVAQRKQQAAAALQHRKELAVQRKEQATHAQTMQNNANTVTKAKKWVTLARKKKAESVTTPIEPIE
ncbi:Myosin-52 [Phytophthora fragariae]|uniref:Myosin-52 n=1 Tax=Phytophthora fragariae TaxID=53985 RepID=A0A6G0LMS9_9STRA|nr:Myosin-52 [Phytophthora fragariae]